jgi:hypothetical protein
MPADWRNTKKRDPEPAEMVAVRLPATLKHRAQEIAEGGNSTLAAAVRWGLEKFIEENSGGKPALFD